MRAILYDKACDCPSSELARAALARARVDFESRPLETQPVDRDAALRLARGARRFLIKAGAGFVQRDADREPVSEAQALEWLLHEDGLLRVPVLVWGDMLVRGYTDELYEQALSGAGGDTAMILKETARSTYMDVSKIEWEPTRFPGVYTKKLYEDASGKTTSLTKMEPGARLPDHRHVGIEQSFVLEGTLVDEDGACTAGNYVWRRPGSVHNAWSPDGCIVFGVFDKPNEFLS